MLERRVLRMENSKCVYSLGYEKFICGNIVDGNSHLPPFLNERDDGLVSVYQIRMQDERRGQRYFCVLKQRVSNSY